MARYNKNKHLNLMGDVKVGKRVTVKELIFDSLITEMSKDKYELFNDAFVRVSEVTGKSVPNIKNYWCDLKVEIPVIFSKYPHLTREQKEILLIKSTAFGRETSSNGSINKWTEAEINEYLVVLAKLYDPKITKGELFELVSKEINRTQKAVEALWYGRLCNSYNEYGISPQEKEIISFLKPRKYLKTERQKLVTTNLKNEKQEDVKEPEKVKSITTSKPKHLKPSEFRSNKFCNHPVKNILEDDSVNTDTILDDKKTNVLKPEDIASKEYLEKFNIPTSNEKENLITEFEESEYIFRKISENEYEVLKGVVTITKEFVEEKLKSNKKVVVLKDDNQLKAKNYL